MYITAAPERLLFHALLSVYHLRVLFRPAWFPYQLAALRTMSCTPGVRWPPAVIAVIDNCEFILRLCLNISFRHPENGCCSGWRPLHHHCFCFICHLCLVCSICVSRQCVCVGLHAQITILNIAICVSALNDTAILISHVARTTIQLCVICVRRYFSLRFILRHQPQTRAYCIITFRCTLFMSAALANFISRQTNRGQLHPIKLSIDSNCGFDCSAEHTKSLAIKQRNKQNAKFISNIFLIQWIFS